jgi:hypothetical protein
MHNNTYKHKKSKIESSSLFLSTWDSESDTCKKDGTLSGSSSSVHYGRSNLCRVPRTSPRAKNRALGEDNLPRVLHSGKNCTRGRRAHEKEKLHLTATIDGAVYKKIEKTLPRVPSPSTRGRWPLPRVPSPWHLGKGLFPECLVTGTRGNIFVFLFFFAPFFLRPSNII